MTKASDTGLRQNRVVMMMSDAELKAVDDWRFKHRIGSRGEAIRRLASEGILASQKRTLAAQVPA